MYYKNRKFTALRKRMKEQLIQLGWKEQENHYPANGKQEMMAGYNSPHIDNSLFWYENCLKKLNPTGEAYYALEWYSSYVAHLAWQTNYNNPNNKNPIDTLDAFEYFREYLLDGIDFDYGDGKEGSKGHIILVDWEHPENNTFEFVIGWRGALNDGFAWDFVLFVNAMPVGAILIKEDVEDTVEPCEKSYDLAQYQLDKDFQFPVYCHSMLISNGKDMRMGYPWEDLSDLREVNSLDEVLKPTEFLINYVKEMKD